MGFAFLILSPRYSNYLSRTAPTVSRPWKNLWFGFIYVTEVMPFIAVNYWTLYDFSPGNNRQKSNVSRVHKKQGSKMSFTFLSGNISKIFGDFIWRSVQNHPECLHMYSTSKYFVVPTHGSPNTLLCACSRQEAFPWHSRLTIIQGFPTPFVQPVYVLGRVGCTQMPLAVRP